LPKKQRNSKQKDTKLFYSSRNYYGYSDSYQLPIANCSWLCFTFIRIHTMVSDKVELQEGLQYKVYLITKPPQVVQDFWITVN